MPRCQLLVVLLCLSTWGSARAADDLGIRVPEGFEVSLYADDTLAHDIFSMTIDAQGRVVVAGLGYVKTLHDDDRDGRADRSTLFSPVPASGAHGMYFDGPDLICSGDDAIMRLRDTDGDGTADGEPEIWTHLRHPEHGANGLVRGPDGCYYLICGNDAGISDKQITVVRSPVAHPRCGGVVRFSGDGRPLDVVAHGFRNPYDLDFDAAGHLLTVDADGERDHHLPWYAPTRLFDVAQGMEHGWLLMGWTRGWNRPPSFFDSVERVVEIGRGSPTGLVVYRHRAFPEHYCGGVFSACWSLGKVYYFPLTADGATCRSKLETFMETTGDTGFAPCDLAIGPEGDLYVAIGGRRTRGSVFRVRAVGAKTPSEAKQTEPLDLAAILSADQPLVSWSRAHWVPAARELGVAAFAQGAEDESLSIDQRVRAIEIVVELSGGPDNDWADRVARSSHPQLRARIAWALARAAGQPAAQQILSRLTSDPDPAVARFAWVGLGMAEQIDEELPTQPDWSAGLSSPVRRVRAGSIAMARGAGEASYRKFVAAGSVGDGSSAAKTRQELAALWIKLPDVSDDERPVFTCDEFRVCANLFDAARTDTTAALEAVRLVQIGLGDLRTKPGQAEVYCGYVANRADQLDDAIRAELVARFAPAYPTRDAELNRELARLLGMLSAEHKGLLPAIARNLTTGSSVEDDVHYLIVASLLPGKRDAKVTAATASALLRLHGKLDSLGQFASRNWPERVGEAFDELCRRDPRVPRAVIDSELFGHAGHALFAEHLKSKAREIATRKLWSQTEARGDEPTSELVALVAKLPDDEARPMLLAAWEHGGLRDSVTLALARSPRPEDRARLVEALASPQPLVVERAARALVSLGLNCSSAEMATALRALKLACAGVKQPEPRRALVELLNFWTEENSGVDEDPDPTQAYVGWYKLFEDYYPQSAAELKRSSWAGVADWKRRLATVDWSTGDATRGRAIYEHRSCHRCHEQNGHLGPELKGAATRMSRDDLFMTIVDPNLEVSPAFQTTLIATNSGQVYHGLVVYESPEITLLQTGPDVTVRITNTDQASARPSTQSLMPSGLLDTLVDADLSDLYAYLRTLSGK